MIATHRELEDHAAFVTGSTHGVGRAVAEALSSAGAAVVVHGLTDESAEAVLTSCRAKGARRASLVTGDLSGSATGVRAVFEAAVAAEPGIDLLVNNAGQFFDVPYLEMDEARFDATMDLNVKAPYFLTQLFARRWIEGGASGRVVLVGSINGRLAEPDSTAYDVSKGAVEMMVRTLCVALAGHGVRVNGIAPGLVRTAQTEWLDRFPERAAWMSLHTPNREIPEAAVCGAATAFLLSDAAAHIHGHMLAVDGGMSAWQQPAAPR